MSITNSIVVFFEYLLEFLSTGDCYNKSQELATMEQWEKLWMWPHFVRLFGYTRTLYSREVVSKIQRCSFVVWIFICDITAAVDYGYHSHDRISRCCNWLKSLSQSGHVLILPTLNTEKRVDLCNPSCLF